MVKKITYTLAEGEQILAEFNADNSGGFLCFFKRINESSVIITNRRVIAASKLGAKICCCCGAVTTSFKECLISGLSGINSYSYVNGRFCCCRDHLFKIAIGTVDGSAITFFPAVETEDEAQAILHKIAEVTEQK